MAFEAEIVIEVEPAIPMTVSTTAAIEKGTLLTLSDPFTVAAHAGGSAAAIAGGILKTEKLSGDLKAFAAVWRRGYFKCKMSGSGSAGNAVTTDTHANHLKAIGQLTAFDLSGGRVWGVAMEDWTTGQTALVYLNPESGGSGLN